MINNKEKLYELGGVVPDKHYKWDKKKKAEQEGNSH
jgi:NADH-quinone oxidoreductase subunit I